MSELGSKHRDEKLSEIVLPNIDCECMDPRTRKVLTYVLDKELKYLSKFPNAMVDDAKYSIEALKEKITQCDLPKISRKTTSDGEPKKKREPSKYNLHMKECATGKEKGGRGRSWKECIGEWQEQKKE